MKDDMSRMLCSIPGVMAVLLWSMSICVSRSLAENIGIFTSTTLIFLLGGAISLAIYLDWTNISKQRNGLSAKYLIYCGIPFVLYIVFLYLAIGLAKDNRQLIEVGLLNYLWPSLTIVLSIPILKNKASALLPLGIAVSTAGIAVGSGVIGGSSFDIAHLLSGGIKGFCPYVLAFGAATMWALYSNMACRMNAISSRLGVPLFLLASGLLMLPAIPFFPETHKWDAKTITELAFMVFLPTIASYVMWDISIRKGSLVLVASFAYFLPLLSTIATIIYFGEAFAPNLWIACGLVVIGAGVCKFSVKNRSRQHSA